MQLDIGGTKSPNYTAQAEPPYNLGGSVNGLYPVIESVLYDSKYNGVSKSELILFKETEFLVGGGATYIVNNTPYNLSVESMNATDVLIKYDSQEENFSLQLQEPYTPSDLFEVL